MTIREFVDIVCAHFGGREETVRLDGETIHYLFRTDPDGQPYAAVLPEDRSSQLEQATLESLCVQLGLSPRDFGPV